MTNKERFSKFLRVMNGIDVYYAYVKVDPVLLNQPIPEVILDMVFGEDRDFETLTLGEFTIGVNQTKDINDTDILIALCAKTVSYGRKSANTEDDLNLWLQYITNYGFTFDDILDIDEYNELKAPREPTPWVPEEE